MRPIARRGAPTHRKLVRKGTYQQALSSRAVEGDPALAMIRRFVVTGLWFLAGWSAGALSFGLAGLPPLLAVVPALISATWVWMDARAWTVSPRVTRRVRPADEVAAELDRKTGAAQGEAARRTVR